MVRADADLMRRLAWLAVLLYLAGLGVAAVLRVQADFNTYYLAGARAARSEPLYRLTDRSLFLYAPVFAFGFAPFSALPLRAAQAAWFAINAFALLSLIFAASRVVFGRARRLPAGLIVLPLLFSARFIDNNIEHGQINLITIALTAWAIVSAEAGQAKRSGAMLAVATLIKPYALLGALYLALRRLFLSLGWMVVAGALLLLLPILFLGWRGALDETLSYVRAVASMTGRYRLMITNQSAASAVARIIVGRGYAPPSGARVPLLLGMALEAAFIVGASLWILRSPGDRANPAPHDRLALCGLFCLMPSFAPVSWKSYYAALLIPYMALLSTLWIDRPADLEPSAAAWLLLALSILLNLAPGRDLSHLALFYSAHFVSSLAALGALFAAWRADENSAAKASPGLTLAQAK